MATTKRHNVFISYYHEQDQQYKDRFVRMMGTNIIDRSVNVGAIDDNNLPTDATLQRIREDYIAPVSVVVLIGPCTWQRKYVDWEIGPVCGTHQRIRDVDSWAFYCRTTQILSEKLIVPN